MSIYTDLQSDAVSVDGFANKNALIPTRYGGNKPSYQYLVDGWNAQVNELAKNFNFTDAGFDFATGGTIETYNQLVKDASGNSWQWQGDLPHVVAAGTVPSNPDWQQRTFNESANVSNNDGTTAQDTYDIAKNLSVSSTSEGFFGKAGKVDLRYETDSYYEDLNSGGGSFYYDPLKLKSDHDGVGVISPSVPFSNIYDFWDGVGETDPSGTGCFVMCDTSGIIKASQCGLKTESLFPSTQLYKLINYNVNRWTQDIDALNILQWFAASDVFKTFIVDGMVIYVSGVVSDNWTGKTLKGLSRNNSGIINGNFTAQDGTKHWYVQDLAFYGKIGLFDVPLPITGDETLKDDPAYFYVEDASSFGWGFGVGGAATASSDGNSDDIIFERCYFEMRGGTISGGSAPDDEDRPKVTNVVFRNNINRNCFYHGAASIHFKNMLVHDNIMINQYYGYAVDFSLGSVNCKAYNNISIGLCSGGAKTEARAFPGGNDGCEIYDNHFTVTGGNGFNLVSRLSGSNSKFYSNTIDVYDYTAGTQDTPLIRVVSPNAMVEDNEINVHSVSGSNPLKTVLAISTEVISNYPSVSVAMNRNKFNNLSNSPLRVLNIGTGLKDRITVRDNELNGLFESVFSKAFTGVAGTTTKLEVSGNKGTLGSLFTLVDSESFVDIDIIGNNGELGDNAFNDRLCSISFATISGKLNLLDNHVESDSGSFDVVVGNTGVTLNDVNINGNTFYGLTGALCYLFQGGAEVSCNDFDVSRNKCDWSSATSVAGVRARGATGNFTAAYNQFTNRDTVNDVRIYRPADGADSLYLYNTAIGGVLDLPAA